MPAIVTQEEVNKIFYGILELNLGFTREQVWQALQAESYNKERTIDRLLSSNKGGGQQ